MALVWRDQGEPVSQAANTLAVSERQCALLIVTRQAATAPANFLASTRLKAPINVGSPFNVERRMRADGKPRRTLRSIFSVRAFSINDQARVIAPPTITASGLKPTIRFEIPVPR